MTETTTPRPDAGDEPIDLTQPFGWRLFGEGDVEPDQLVEVSWDPRFPDEVIADHPTDKMNYLSGAQALQYATALMQAARRVSLHAARTATPTS